MFHRIDGGFSECGYKKSIMAHRIWSCRLSNFNFRPRWFTEPYLLLFSRDLVDMR